MKTIKVTKATENQRLDKLLARLLGKAPKSFIYKMLRKKNITLCDKKATGSEMLQAGDVITLYLSDETIENFTEEKKAVNKNAGVLNVLYEDENIVVVNKPAGVLSQKEKDVDNDTVNDRLLAYLDKKALDAKSFDTSFTPSIQNRLDRNTSGIILCGKNLQATKALSKMLADEAAIEKRYVTVVVGELKGKGVLRGFHKKNERTNEVSITEEYVEGSKPVITEYEAVRSNGKYTLLRVWLVTGKSHQIRAHLKTINHPVIGDVRYGDRAVNERLKKEIGLKNQLLHAESVCFNRCHEPLLYLKGKTISCEMPKKFQETLKGVDLF